MKPHHRIILISFLLGVLFWFIDGTLDYLYFYRESGDLLSLLILNVPAHEIYVRLTNFAIFLIFGFIIGQYVKSRTGNLERINHLNRVLLSIRNVNQLIAREKNRDRLIYRACRDLIEHRGYYNTWITLLDREGKYLSHAEAGLGKPFRKMEEKLRNSEFPQCLLKALKSPEPVVIKDPPNQCPDCILNDIYHGRGSYSCRLEHDNVVYGVLIASVPAVFLEDEDEKSLFEEISKDLGLALHDIENEQRRKKAEQDLKDNEQWLSVTLRSIGDAVIATDRDGKITFMNNIASELTGWAIEEARGSMLDEVFIIINENTREAVENPVNKVLRKGKIVGLANHTLLLSKSGREIPIDDSGAPIKNEHGEVIGVVLVFQNITERKRAEELVRKSEETYRNLFHNAQVGLFRTRIEDGKVLECNDRLAEMFRYPSRDEMIKDYITTGNYVDPDARARMLKILEEKGEVRGFETAFYRKDKTPIWVRFSAKIYPKYGWIEGVLEDIDEIVKAQRSLRESEERHRMISELVSDYIYIAEINDNGTPAIKWYTEDIVKLTGKNLDELAGLGTGWATLVVDEDRGIFNDMYARIMEERESAIAEYRINTPDGKTHWIRDYARPLVDKENNRVAAIYGAMQDITRRKQYEEELRQSRERVKAFIDSVDDMAYFQGLDGKLSLLNDAVARITGYSIQEFMDDPQLWKGIIHPDDVAEAKAFFDQHPEGIDFHETYYRLKPKEGGWRWIQSRMYAAHDREGNRIGYYCIDRDITEQRQAERDLAKSEATLKSVFRSAPIGIGMVTNRIIGWINEQITDMTGYTQAELQGESARILYPSEEEYERVGRVKHADIRERGIGSIITKWQRKDGEVIDILLSSASIDPSNMAAGLVFTAMDITDRKRAEEALAAEKERLDVTLRSIGDAVIATDTNGKIVIFNKIAEELTGWSYEEALGQPLTEIFNIINEKTREKCENPIDKVMETNSIVGLANHTVLIARDGTERVIEDSGAPIRNRYGNVIGVVLVFRDVTEAKRLQEFASRAQRLETAGRIAGQVAHDFNNLLAPLTAYPDLVRMELPREHPALKYLDDIERSAEQIAEINQQLLTLGRRGHYNQEPLNLNSIVAQVLNQIKPLPETLNVSVDLNDSVMAIRGGASQIHRLLLNLINNAREAMSDIGSLYIKTENFYVEALSGKYGRVPQGEYVKLQIADTGIGMSDDVKAKIFDPFFTTKSSDKRRGSGLGLSVVHAVMEDHNGFIDCESEPGEGTAFYLYFPITREQVKPAPQDEIFGGTEKILVVDDDPLQLEVCVKLLENLGYRAHAVGSGEEAIEYIKENPQDLIILDMIMPTGIDGTETYRRILEIYPGQKAILVSGYAQSERVEEALSLGAGEYIKKPLSIRVIAHAVRRELDRKAAR